MRQAFTDMENNILHLLYSNPCGLLREDICKKLELKWSSAYYTLDKLRMRGLVITKSPITKPGESGRPKTRWYIK